MASGVEVTPIGDQLAARVTGVDLALPLDEAVRDAIVAALDHYAVLVFGGQPLTADQQVALARQFGPLDTEVQKARKFSYNRLGSEVLTDISNVSRDGAVAGRVDRQTLMNIGNAFWHSDGSYQDRPFRYSMLSCITVASWGGETEFADLRAAYDALDDRTKALLADKTGTFWSPFNRLKLGIVDPPERLALFPPVEWPMVRTHSGSGRKVLWVGHPLCRISGMSIPEGRALAAELLEHATARERVYTHGWTPGDLVMWDNRATLHRGRRFDLSERREMRRAGTMDDCRSLGELPGPANGDINGFLPTESVSDAA